MSQDVYANKNASVYYKLINEQLPAMVKDASFQVGDYKISFELSPVQGTIPIEEDGTVFHMVRVQCMIENVETCEEATFNVNLLKLPVMQELGFKIKGNYQYVRCNYALF